MMVAVFIVASTLALSVSVAPPPDRPASRRRRYPRPVAAPGAHRDGPARRARDRPCRPPHSGDRAPLACRVCGARPGRRATRLPPGLHPHPERCRDRGPHRGHRRPRGRAFGDPGAAGRGTGHRRCATAMADRGAAGLRRAHAGGRGGARAGHRAGVRRAGRRQHRRTVGHAVGHRPRAARPRGHPAGCLAVRPARRRPRPRAPGTWRCSRSGAAVPAPRP
jgi:hypothetical protein